MNLSFVIGNLGSDAKVVDNNGQQFITMSIADSRKYKKQDGSEVTSTNWVDAIISDANHPVLPFLKQGVKVAVIGQSTLRVYSSKKERMMKAGQTIHVLNIELCGGTSDTVPRQLIDPNTGALYDTQKFYWVPEFQKLAQTNPDMQLIDRQANRYMIDANGFVHPEQPQGEGGDTAAAGAAAVDSAAQGKAAAGAAESPSDVEESSAKNTECADKGVDWV